jgi:hypothetical protein
MPKLVQPVTATVELVTALKEGNFGPYRSVLFKNGEEKIWQSFDSDAEELAVLSRGVQVQLVPRGESKQGKTQYNIVLLSAPASSTPMTKRATLSAAKKYEVAAHIEQMAKMYRFCFEQAQIALTGATEDRATVSAAADALFYGGLREVWAVGGVVKRAVGFRKLLKH